MQFGKSHKVASYIMVIAAFVAMTGGGMVSPVASLGGLLGFVVSWFWEPPRVRVERFALAWTIASFLVLIYSAAIAITTGDYLGAGAQFLVWLAVVKACSRRAARDYLQLYLLAFLMLVVGSVLNADLSYGVAFLVFVISSTWAIALFHLRREMEDNLLIKHAADRASQPVEIARILASRRIVNARFFVGTGLLSLGIFVASAVVFLAVKWP